MTPSDLAQQHLVVAAIAGGALLVLALCAAILAYGASRDRGAVGEPSAGAAALIEVGLWTVPTVAICLLFWIGFRGAIEAAVPPADALEITATVEADHYQIDYGDGLVVEDALRVPTDRAVALTLRSVEASTTWVAPSLHLRLDARAERDGAAWLLTRTPGELPIVCTTCDHGEASPRLLALPAAEFDRWRDEADGGKLPPVEYGRKLYARSQCQTCHSLDGTTAIAPSFKGLFGKRETLANGAEVTVDAAYITESILDPTAKVVRGFQPVMPEFRGHLKDKQIAALVAFIESQKP